MLVLLIFMCRLVLGEKIPNWCVTRGLKVLVSLLLTLFCVAGVSCVCDPVLCFCCRVFRVRCRRRGLCLVKNFRVDEVRAELGILDLIHVFVEGVY